ncbi:MAG: class I SAM-dependent methyltransferase [Bacillota bacterium]|nr:class I SAM-dependent methyltransferase [Bacillota bacterium]
MKLNERLTKIALMISKCDAILDVGTDHGYLPIYLVQNNFCKYAIASDINIGPVNKAKLNIKLQGLSDKIECRLGAGLSTIHNGETQCAVIAGMGGNLIRDIIEENIDIFKSFDYAILNPVQNPEVLREYIYKRGFEIIDEDLCIDESKYYEIIKVKYGNKPREIDDIYYEVSKILIDKKHELIKKYIEMKIDKYNKIYNTITDTSINSLDRKKELTDKINKLKELT